MIMNRVVAILGTPVSSGNRGVMALAAALARLCAGPEGTHEVILMLGHRRSEQVPFRIDVEPKLIPVINYRLSPRAKLKEHLGWILIACLIYRLSPSKIIKAKLAEITPWIGALERADIVGDVHGGDSFSDIYGMRRFLTGVLEDLTVVLIKGSIVQFPQTFGPYKSKLAKVLARFILKRSSVIMARDETSRRIAQELVGPSHEVLLSPDVAFSLQPIKPKNVQLFPGKENVLRHNVIGINVNGLMFHGGYTRKNMFGLKLDYERFVPTMIEALLAEHPGELWLVPHTYGHPESVESDTEACRRVRERLPSYLKERVRIVTGEYDCHEIKAIIGGFDFFIGSRMHACIAALSQGVPCIGVAYSRKFKGVFESVGVGEWIIDGRNVGNEEALNKTLELYGKRDSIRRILKENAEKARRDLEKIFHRLLKCKSIQKSRS